MEEQILLEEMNAVVTTHRFIVNRDHVFPISEDANIRSAEHIPADDALLWVGGGSILLVLFGVFTLNPAPLIPGAIGFGVAWAWWYFGRSYSIVVYPPGTLEYPHPSPLFRYRCGYGQEHRAFTDRIGHAIKKAKELQKEARIAETSGQLRALKGQESR